MINLILVGIFLAVKYWWLWLMFFVVWCAIRHDGGPTPRT